MASSPIEIDLNSDTNSPVTCPDPNLLNELLRLALVYNGVEVIATITDKTTSSSLGLIPLRRMDYKRFMPGKWLNDATIDFCFTMIRNEQDDAREVRLCSSTIHTNILTETYRDNIYREWSESESLLIPVNVENVHWTLVHVKMKEQKIQYLNSLTKHDDEKKTGQGVMKKIQTKMMSLNPGKWPIEMMDVPQQPNTFDCGIYVIIFAEMIAQGKEIVAGQTHDPKIYRENLKTHIAKTHIKLLRDMCEASDH